MVQARISDSVSSPLNMSSIEEAYNAQRKGGDIQKQKGVTQNGL